MNRPKRENYKSHIEYDEYGVIEFNGIDDYYAALEKYCDELEYKLEVLKEEYNADQKYIENFDTTKDWYWKKIKQLEKALDKACKFISGIFNDHEDEKIYWEKECWKEWLMNDE